ncbi:hypothetical protein [Mycobacterium sp.]|uniref:hypothetical protein n=1 Tax=Mycobacterium sp. TaxID=1785 RepID=UPI0025F0EBEA|nr:hypothetical protein [Mycobacterium sp.]
MSERAFSTVIHRPGAGMGMGGMPIPGGIFMSFIMDAQQSINWAAGIRELLSKR